MKWMNSESVRKALFEMADAMSKHDSAMGHMLNCKQRVEEAERELVKAELKVGENQTQMNVAQAVLTEQGFITNPSVYEPEKT